MSKIDKYVFCDKCECNPCECGILEQFDKEFPEFKKYKEDEGDDYNGEIENFITKAIQKEKENADKWERLNDKAWEKRLKKEKEALVVEVLQNQRGVMGKYNCPNNCKFQRKYYELVEKEIQAICLNK